MDIYRQKIVRYLDACGKRVSSTTPGARRVETHSKKWYIKQKNKAGTWVGIPLSKNKAAARIMAGKLTDKQEMAKAGVVDKFEGHRKKPLTRHLEDWRACLAETGEEKHVRHTVGSVERLIRLTSAVFPDDLDAAGVQLALGELRKPPANIVLPSGEEFTRNELAAILGMKLPALSKLMSHHRVEATGNGRKRRYPRTTLERLANIKSRGRGARTINFHLASIKQFYQWMEVNSRIDKNPLNSLKGGNVETDPRHKRRAATEDELQRLLMVTYESKAIYRDMTGYERGMLYLTASITGFRAEELSTLRTGDFGLTQEPPVVVLAAINAKNGQTAIQPIPLACVAMLKLFLASKGRNDLVWPGNWFEKAAEVLRHDLEAAGIPYVIETSEGPKYLDFHGMGRHTFISMLDKSGATLKEAMQLARHSDPKLTMAVYGRAQLADLSQAVSRLPVVMLNGLVTHRVTHANATACENMSRNEKTPVRIRTGVNRRKVLPLQGIENNCDSMHSDEMSAPCRARTYDPLIKSQLLYQLS
jgi:integrase